MQEEARLEACEEKLGQEDQALTVQARRGKGKVKDRLKRKFQKHIIRRARRQIQTYDASPARNWDTSQEIVHWFDKLKKNEGNKRHHANVVEDEGPSQKKERTNNSDIEYSLISALTGTVTHGNDTWLIVVLPST